MVVLLRKRPDKLGCSPGQILKSSWRTAGPTGVIVPGGKRDGYGGLHRRWIFCGLWGMRGKCPEECRLPIAKCRMKRAGQLFLRPKPRKGRGCGCPKMSENARDSRAVIFSPWAGFDQPDKIAGEY